MQHGGRRLAAQERLRGRITLAEIDAGENVIHKFEVWPLGVDARGVLWSRSHRTDHLDSQIDPAYAAQAARNELWLGHMPKNRWDQIMAESGKK